jgi:hypothetical protein
MIMVMVKPRKTGANAVPKSWLERSNSSMKTVSNCALTANETEVVINARLLARNSLFLLIVSMSLGFR